MKTRFHSQTDDSSNISYRKATQQEVKEDLIALTAVPPSPYKRKTAYVKAKSFRRVHRQKNKAMVDALLGVATLISEKIALSAHKPQLSGFYSNSSAIHHSIAHYIKKHNTLNNKEL